MTTDNTMRHNDPHPEAGAADQLAAPPAVTNPDRVTSPIRPGTARQMAAWMGWHALELTATGVPLVLAVTVDGWWAAVSALVGAGWAGHEIQLVRRYRAADGETPRLRDAGSENPDALTGKDRDHDR